MSRHKKRHKKQRSRVIRRPYVEPNTYEEYLRSTQWRIVRRTCLKRDHFLCLVCGANTNLEVHHLRYRTLWIQTVPLDCVTLCSACHEKTHRLFPPMSCPFPPPRHAYALRLDHALLKQLTAALNR